MSDRQGPYRSYRTNSRPPSLKCCCSTIRPLLFNASLDAGTRGAIDLREGDSLDEDAFRALVREAVARNI